MRFAHQSQGKPVHVNIIWQSVVGKRVSGHLGALLAPANRWTMIESLSSCKRRGVFFVCNRKSSCQRRIRTLHLTIFHSQQSVSFKTNVTSDVIFIVSHFMRVEITVALPNRLETIKSFMNQFQNRTHPRKPQSLKACRLSCEHWAIPSFELLQASSQNNNGRFLGFAMKPDFGCDQSLNEDHEELEPKIADIGNQLSRTTSLQVQTSKAGLLFIRLHSMSFGSSFVRIRFDFQSNFVERRCWPTEPKRLGYGDHTDAS